LRAGVVLSIDANGREEWRTEKRLPVTGSWDARIHLRRDHYGLLEIDGNPSKFLQGHNLFGSEDIIALGHAVVARAYEAIRYTPTAEERALLAEDAVEVCRVDINRNWSFGTLARALNAIRALGQLSSMRHRGLGSAHQEGTVYFRQKSRRIAAKFYAKGHELAAREHTLPPRIEHRDELHAYAQALVRFEVCFRAMWLKDHDLSLLANWRRITPAALLDEQLAKVRISEVVMRDARVLEDLPPRLQAVYQLWLEGHDIRGMYPRRTFYRYRTALLAFDIDVAVKRPRDDSNVVPLRIVLHGQPAEIPSWARGTPLLFEPTPRAA
jgi:II/X family phage/plasmid replication protein